MNFAKISNNFCAECGRKFGIEDIWFGKDCIDFFIVGLFFVIFAYSFL
jgi:hypothetical protein